MSKRLMPEMIISPQGTLLNMGIINKKTALKISKKLQVRLSWSPPEIQKMSENNSSSGNYAPENKY